MLQERDGICKFSQCNAIFHQFVLFPGDCIVLPDDLPLRLHSMIYAAPEARDGLDQYLLVV